MSKEVANPKRKASTKDARPAKKVKAGEKAQVEPVKSKSKASTDAKKSRKRAAEAIDEEEAAPAVQPVAEGSPKQKKVKISKKVEVVEPVPTSISKTKGADKKKEKKPKKVAKSDDSKALVLAEQEDEIALPAADEDEEEDVAKLLAGFSSDEEDGEEVEDKDGVALDQVPGPALDRKAKKALAKAQKAAAEADTPGTIYIGRIPHGFYEPQMRAYFTQFGQILQLRLARNKKTGASKHYAFLQFSSSEVADIVARTMNNYLMFGHILKVHTVPEEQIHPDLWKGANKRFKVVPRAMLERKAMEAPKGREYWKEKGAKEEKKRKEKAKKLADLGYEYEAPKLKNVDDVPMKDVPAATEKNDGAEENRDQATGDGNEELVKAITDASAVVDEVQAAFDNVVKEAKKENKVKKDKKEKKDKAEKVEQIKVKVSKKKKA